MVNKEWLEAKKAEEKANGKKPHPVLDGKNPFQPHNDVTKAAVMAALLEGQSINAVSKEYKVSRETIRKWGRQNGAGRAPVPSEDQQNKIAGLICNLLETNLATLQVHAGLAQNKEWVDKQSAAELATFYGVISDKTFRILEALDRGQETHDVETSGGLS